MLKAQVILYSRPGCHLCEELKEVLLSSGCEELFNLEEINIDDNLELYERYKYDIPVVMINGVEKFIHRVTREEFVAEVKKAAIEL